MQNVNLLVWSPAYSVGIQAADDQHRRLCELINDLSHHVSGNEDEEREYFRGAIQQVVQYVKVHFVAEEETMLRKKHEGHHEHKKIHDAFIITVVDYIRDFEAGKKFNRASFTEFLNGWVLSHIAIMNKRYFTYYKQMPAGRADEKLTITIDDVNRRC